MTQAPSIAYVLCASEMKNVIGLYRHMHVQFGQAICDTGNMALLLNVDNDNSLYYLFQQSVIVQIYAYILL